MQSRLSTSLATRRTSANVVCEYAGAWVRLGPHSSIFSGANVQLDYHDELPLPQVSRRVMMPHVPKAQKFVEKSDATDLNDMIFGDLEAA